MGKATSVIDESVASIASQMSRQFFMQAMSKLPASMTMGALVADIASSSFGDQFNALTIGQFIEAVRGGGRSSGQTGGNFNTRTQTGRDQIDASISGALERMGSSGAESIRKEIGGSAAQIRESMARLAKQGLVKITGQKRATQYHWTGKGKKK